MWRLDEIGENYEELQDESGTRLSRREEKETAVPMELDHVSGSELYDDDVDEVRGDERCHNCGMMRHFARDCSMRGEGKGKGRDEGKEQVKGEGKVEKERRKGKVQASSDVSGEQSNQGCQVVRMLVGSRQESGERSESEKDDDVGGVCIVGNVGELEDEMTSECRERREVEGGTGGPGCRSKHWAQIDANQRDGCSENQRGGFGNIRACRQVESENSCKLV